MKRLKCDEKKKKIKNTHNTNTTSSSHTPKLKMCKVLDARTTLTIQTQYPVPQRTGTHKYKQDTTHFRQTQTQMTKT